MGFGLLVGACDHEWDMGLGTPREPALTYSSPSRIGYTIALFMGCDIALYN